MEETMSNLDMINSLRDKVITALAFVRMVETDDKDLASCQASADQALSDALVELGDVLDSYRNN
ncbi:hypothetical protein OAF96_00520 [bacterium]|nr:hypothetical protein [bacterium]